jgi:hypothetical protein
VAGAARGALTVLWLSRSAACFAVPAVRPRLAQPQMASPAAGPHFYPVGKPGVPWGSAERAAWRQLVEQEPKRSYRAEVLDKVEKLRDSGQFAIEQYGALECDTERYPLMVVKNKAWDAAKPAILVTGGVHGYETSGVQGALLFLQTRAGDYLDNFNMVVAPCVSPWGYEYIQV